MNRSNIKTMEKFNRHSIRLKDFDYSQANWFFITICTFKMQPFFGEIRNGMMNLNEFGKIVDDEWNKTKSIRQNVELDSYVIMPNHLHGILIIDKMITSSSNNIQNNNRANQRFAPTLQPNSLGSILGQFKSIVTKRIRNTGQNNFKWHRNYYEHIIRNENDLHGIRKYIKENPLKWKYEKNLPVNLDIP